MSVTSVRGQSDMNWSCSCPLTPRMEMAGAGKRIKQNPGFGLGLGGRKQRGERRRIKVPVAAKGSRAKELPKSCRVPPTARVVMPALIRFQSCGQVSWRGLAWQCMRKVYRGCRRESASQVHSPVSLWLWQKREA